MDRILVNMMRVAPLRGYTRLIYMVARIPLPRPLRPAFYNWLGPRMGMDLSEAELDLSEYRCFQDLFVRRLRAGARPVDGAEDGVISPVDACISACGEVRRGSLIQAKGIEYPLEELVKDPEWASELEGGHFMTLYLRPKDYHRIHSPLEGRVVGVRRVPGTLFPVQPYMVRGLRGLFVRNERLVLRLETTLGSVALVCVGATGVGTISLAFDTEEIAVEGRRVSKGDEVAAFNLGSTVILILPPCGVELAGLEPGQEVRVGHVLATVGNSSGVGKEN